MRKNLQESEGQVWGPCSQEQHPNLEISRPAETPLLLPLSEDTLECMFLTHAGHQTLCHGCPLKLATYANARIHFFVLLWRGVSAR